MTDRPGMETALDAQADESPSSPSIEPSPPCVLKLRPSEAVVLHDGHNPSLPPMIEIPLSLGPTTLRAIVKPPDADTLWSWYELRNDSDADPSWANVWPTAASLCSYLASKKEKVKGKSVAELGCGLGVAGLTAAALGAKSVLLLDREPYALHCAMSTAAVNGIPASPAAGGVAMGHVSASVYDWSDPSLTDTKLDVVLASDVLYDVDTVVDLAAAAKTFLNDKGGVVLIADPERERAKGCREAFLEALKRLGFGSIEVLRQPAETSDSAALGLGDGGTREGCEERVVIVTAVLG